jgi:hypothetical protein
VEEETGRWRSENEEDGGVWKNNSCSDFLLCKYILSWVFFFKNNVQVKLKVEEYGVAVQEVDVYVQFCKTISTSSSGKYNRRF